MKEEIWCYIKGYEGLYEVSNYGRVRSLKFGKEKILKPSRDTDGYLFVGIRKNGHRKICRVHRLVAETFIPNPSNLSEINHLDEDKDNNLVQNLEWCDRKYNCNYGNRNKRISEKMTNGKLSKLVLQYTKSGEFVKEWKSMNDVQRNLGYSTGNISSCCTGRRKNAYNFIWKFKD